jgi:hypothetical protein
MPDKKENLVAIMKPLFQVYQSKEGIENLAFEELRAFHFPFGAEFDAKVALEYEDELPNVFGGKPIKVDTKITVENYEYEYSYCELRQRMKLNEKDTKRVVLEYLKKAGLSANALNKAMRKAVLRIDDDNRYNYFYYPGIPYQITMKRMVSIDIEGVKTKRNDYMRIEIVE